MTDFPTPIAEILRACDLKQDAVWKHAQSGSWIVKHWACEIIGAAKGVVFAAPQIVEASAEKKLAIIVVSGTLGDRTEWSFGEAAPYNTKQSYPFAMAEKRAKDRVILKLINLHGVAYSDAEAEEFASAPPAAEPEVSQAQKTRTEWAERRLGKTAWTQELTAFVRDIEGCADLDSLDVLLGTDKGQLLQQECMDWMRSWWDGKDDIEGLGPRITRRQNELRNIPTE